MKKLFVDDKGKFSTQRFNGFLQNIVGLILLIVIISVSMAVVYHEYTANTKVDFVPLTMVLGTILPFILVLLGVVNYQKNQAKKIEQGGA